MKPHGKFTAEIVALARAAGHLETDPAVRNPDFLAGRLLSSPFRIALSPGIRHLLRAAYGRIVPGMYHYHQARTRHIDKIVLELANGELRQFVILGAGLDSRPYRLSKKLADVRVFEVDHPATAACKQRRLAKAALRTSHVTFVAVDLTRDRLADRLTEAGCDMGLRTLFLLEGVLYYLPEASVRHVLQALSSAPCGSSLVFDYVMSDVIAHPEQYYGASCYLDYVARKGEPVLFGIAPDAVVSFLQPYGYTVQSHLGPLALSNEYLVKSSGARWGPVCEIFGIVHATRS